MVQVFLQTLKWGAGLFALFGLVYFALSLLGFLMAVEAGMLGAALALVFLSAMGAGIAILYGSFWIGLDQLASRVGR